LSLSIVNATFVPSRSTFILGASGNVPNTISWPFQWNQIGTTRGVPSLQLYASRAGSVDCSSFCATGSSSSARLPCLVVMVPSFKLSACRIHSIGSGACCVRIGSLIERIYRLPLPAIPFGDDTPEAGEWEMESQRQHLIDCCAVENTALGLRSLILPEV